VDGISIDINSLGQIDPIPISKRGDKQSFNHYSLFTTMAFHTVVMGRYTENTEPISDISKKRYRYRRRYLEYRKIPNTDN